MTTRPTHPNRSAFTLVELLVVMTVIGILVGLLAAGVIPALRRASEFAIQTEITQLERAIESFNTKYGFYPPSFVTIQNPGDVDGVGGITDTDRQLRLLAYINRIAPNHSETTINTVTGNTYIQDWWTNVGQNIGFGTGEDLVFWLSGLAKNKQFPLSGNPAPQVDGWWAFGADPVNERELFYDFSSKQLLVTGGTAAYVQPKGKQVPFLYIDHSSYGYGPSLPPAQGGPVFFDAFSSSLGTFTGPTFNPGQYENPNTFQIVTVGMDGLVGAPWEPNPVDTTNFTTNWRSFTGNEATDNMCSFAGGRLERMLLGTN